MSKPAPNLATMILLDLLTVGRKGLILLLMIFVSAMGVVLATHLSRQAIALKDHTLTERERLDSEWRNLMLEETALAEHSRVQELAVKELEMQRPESDKEVVLTLK